MKTNTDTRTQDDSPDYTVVTYSEVTIFYKRNVDMWESNLSSGSASDKTSLWWGLENLLRILSENGESPEIIKGFVDKALHGLR